MNSTVRSLIVPAILSALSLTATFYWFGKWERESSLSSADDTPIAYLKANTEKIERRSKARIMWQAIEQGGPIYDGDAVRTPPKAEGNVQLIQGNTIVTLEPDSLIVLEQSKGRLELNLVSGSLLVDSKGDGKSAEGGPVIKAGATKVDLGKKGAQLSLSKTQGAEATVAVAKGQVELATGGKKVVVDEGKVGTLSAAGLKTVEGLETLSPKPNEILLLNKLPGRVATFTWKPLTGEGKVHLEVGAFRNEIKDVGVSAAPAVGRVSMQVPAGPFYWRLVRRDPTGKPVTSSMALRAEGVFVAPPSLYSPADSEVFVLKGKPQAVSFNWGRPAKASELTLEISGDKAFGSGVTRTKLSLDDQEKTVTLSKEGVYYWRVVGKWPVLTEALASEARRVEIRKMADVPVPVATAPAAGAAFTEAGLKAGGVYLEWDQVPGVAKYRVQVLQGGKIKVDETLAATGHRVKDLAPGSYDWRIMAIAGEGMQSKWSANRGFRVNKAVDLKWKSKFPSAHEYTTPKPSVVLEWEPGPADVARYRIRYATSKEDLASASWTKAAKSAITMTHQSDGVYYYEVNALNSSDGLLAVSQPLRVELKVKPELDPPILYAPKPVLTASADGSLHLKWKQVQGASVYGISVKPVDGGKAMEFKSSDNNYQLKDLLPGKYEVRLRSQGQQGKPGSFGKPKQIVVPNVSDVPPPTPVEFKVH